MLIVLCLAALAAADYDPGYAPPPVAAYDPWYAPRPEPSRVCCSPKLGKQCLPVVCEPNKKPCNPCVCPPKQPCQPVVCPPHGGVCQLAEIYYRYNIKYPCENCASQVMRYLPDTVNGTSDRY